MKLVDKCEFETYVYDSHEEKDSHKKVMINNGWNVDEESWGEEIIVEYIKIII